MSVRVSMFKMAHLSSLDGDFPPRKKARLPLWVSVHWNISVLYVVHRLHWKRKYSTVSVACPHAHWSVGAAAIRRRYPFSLAMPVLSWASTFASFYESLSYSCRACFPGNAVSIFLEYFSTVSGNRFMVSCLARAELSSVDFVLGSPACGQDWDRVDSLACSLATFLSSFSSAFGVHRTVIAFPSLRSRFTAS